MCTRSSSKVYNRWTLQNVLTPEPHPASPAALALLSQHLFLQDKSIYTHIRMLKIRDQWMTEQMQHPDALGGLTCVMCGRQGLEPFTKDISQMATLDHIQDIGLGGCWNDPTNFQVACYHCNQRKSR